MSTTSATTATNATNYDQWSTKEYTLPSKTLDQEDFFKLLMAQMTSQDPLNPKGDTDYVAQMAQFSALDSVRSMQEELTELRAQQQQYQANALLGRTVEIQSGPDTKVTGMVEAVHLEQGYPQVVVNGQSYDLSQLLNITPSTPAIT